MGEKKSDSAGPEEDKVVITAGYPPVDGHGPTALVKISPEFEGASAEVKQGLIGTTLDTRYQVLEAIGEGGMGMVLKGFDGKLETDVAIKVLHEDLMSREEQRKRFRREAITIAGLKNAHIVTVIDIGTTPDGRIYFVMEYIQGASLDKSLGGDNRLFTWARAQEILLQICDAMQAAHEKGIVHRDLKPENILLTRRSSRPDFVKILDFGIAKDVGPDSADVSLTKTGMVFGTPKYISPEQARGKIVDHRVDIYALGLIMHELLTGKLPFNLDERDELVDILSAQINEAPAPPLEVNENADISPEIEAIILKALDKDPNKRFQTMNEMAAAIGKACPRFDSGASPTLIGMEGLVPLGNETIAIREQAYTLPRIVRKLILGLVIGSALVGGGGILYVMSNNQKSEGNKTALPLISPISNPDSSPGTGKPRSDAGPPPKLDALVRDAGEPDSAVDSHTIDSTPLPPTPDQQLSPDKKVKKKPRGKNGRNNGRKNPIPKPVPAPQPKVEPKPGDLPENPNI